MHAQTAYDARNITFRPEALDDYLSRPTPGAIAAVAALPDPVVVLGAGGKMGLHLCGMLRQAARAVGRELRVIAVSRFQSLRDRETFVAAGIPIVPCDLSVREAVARLPEAPTVFFLAGVKFGTASSPELLEKMNVMVPQLVAERYRRSVIVAFSTGCVYPFVPVNSGGARETLTPQPVGAYAASCVQREEVFARSALTHGTKVVLIRLNYAVEFRYGVLVDIATKVRGAEPLDVSTGYVNLIWQADALAHIIQATAIAAAPSVPLNVTGPRIHRVRDLAERFGELMGVTPHIVGTEQPTAWLSNAERSHSMFGPPATDLETMQIRVAAWLAGGGTTWGKATGFEKRDGNF